MSITPDFQVPYFPAGYGPQQADFTTWWAATAAFMQQRVVFRATQATTTTTLPSARALETIIYDTVLEDPYDGYNASTGKWTAPVAGSGLYCVTARTFVQAPPALGTVLQQWLGTPDGEPISLQDVPMAECVIPEAPGGVCGSAYTFLTGGQDYVYIAASVSNLGSGNVTTSNTGGQRSDVQVTWIQS